ncbi:conserved membrane protein, unknown function, partial [Hepatocystis sp. ex Piliocolobus tephrosceles]
DTLIYNAVPHLFNCNLDCLKLLQELYKNTNTNKDFFKYLSLLKKEEHFVYFFETHINAILRIFQEYYANGYTETFIYFEKDKINSNTAKNIIQLFIKYCNFPTYSSFWNTVLDKKCKKEEKKKNIFIPHKKYIYDYEYSKHVQHMLLAVDKEATEKTKFNSGHIKTKNTHVLNSIKNIHNCMQKNINNKIDTKPVITKTGNKLYNTYTYLQKSLNTSEYQAEKLIDTHNITL